MRAVHEQDRIDRRLAMIYYLIMTAVVPDDGYRWRCAHSDYETLKAWTNAYLYGPVWERS